MTTLDAAMASIKEELAKDLANAVLASVKPRGQITQNEGNGNLE